MRVNWEIGKRPSVASNAKMKMSQTPSEETENFTTFSCILQHCCHINQLLKLVILNRHSQLYETDNSNWTSCLYFEGFCLSVHIFVNVCVCEHLIW